MVHLGQTPCGGVSHARSRVRHGKRAGASHEPAGAAADIDGPVGGWGYALGLPELNRLGSGTMRVEFGGGGGSRRSVRPEPSSCADAAGARARSPGRLRSAPTPETPTAAESRHHRLTGLSTRPRGDVLQSDNN